jgi:hypothetical protein
MFYFICETLILTLILFVNFVTKNLMMSVDQSG